MYLIISKKIPLVLETYMYSHLHLISPNDTIFSTQPLLVATRTKYMWFRNNGSDSDVSLIRTMVSELIYRVTSHESNEQSIWHTH